MWLNNINDKNKKENNEKIKSIQNDIQDATKWMVEDILNFVDEYKVIISLIPWMIAMWMLDNELIWVGILYLWFLSWEKWEKMSDINKKKIELEDVLNKKTNNTLVIDYFVILKNTEYLLDKWLQWISSSVEKMKKIPNWIFVIWENNPKKILNEYDESKLSQFFESTVIPELKIVLSKIDENKFRI